MTVFAVFWKRIFKSKYDTRMISLAQSTVKGNRVWYIWDHVIMTYAFSFNWIGLDACDVMLFNMEENSDWPKDFRRGSSVTLCFFPLWYSHITWHKITYIIHWAADIGVPTGMAYYVVLRQPILLRSPLCDEECRQSWPKCILRSIKYPRRIEHIE